MTSATSAWRLLGAALLIACIGVVRGDMLGLGDIGIDINKQFDAMNAEMAKMQSMLGGGGDKGSSFFSSSSSSANSLSVGLPGEAGAGGSPKTRTVHTSSQQVSSLTAKDGKVQGASDQKVVSATTTTTDGKHVDSAGVAQISKKSMDGSGTVESSKSNMAQTTQTNGNKTKSQEAFSASAGVGDKTIWKGSQRPPKYVDYPKTTAKRTCTTGWSEHKDSLLTFCYKRFNTTLYHNFIEAKLFCAQQRSRLIGIHDESQIDFLKKEFGGTKDNSMDVLVGFNRRSRPVYVNDDESPTTVDATRIRQPIQKDDDCVVMTWAGLKGANCHQPFRHVLCYHPNANGFGPQ